MLASRAFWTPSGVSDVTRVSVSPSLYQGVMWHVTNVTNCSRLCATGKAVSEAPMPGHTRSIGGVVKVAEPSRGSGGKSVYVFDTPGIMPPFLGKGDDAGSRAFKIALTGDLKSLRQKWRLFSNTICFLSLAGLKDSLFDSFDLAAYLLHSLLLRYSSPPHSLSEISTILSLPSSLDLLPVVMDPGIPLPIEGFLESIARRIKALESGGFPDLEAAAQWLFKCFRDGRFGQWTLDDVGQYASIDGQPPIAESTLNLSTSASNALRLPEVQSIVTTTVSDFLAAGHHRPQSRTAIKMAERRKGKAIQRANSLSNLQRRRARG